MPVEQHEATGSRGQLVREDPARLVAVEDAEKLSLLHHHALPL
jgi:hypothetical protein